MNLQNINPVDLLPKKTQNGEPFGLMFMVNGSQDDLEQSWTVCYYTHYSKLRDDRIPFITGRDITHVAAKIFYWLYKTLPGVFKGKDAELVEGFFKAIQYDAMIEKWDNQFYSKTDSKDQCVVK